MDKRQMTIKDVALQSGVSIATVSRYLNGKYEYMSESTKQRIEKVVLETGFVPNQIANGLRTKKSDLIGLVMSNVRGSRTPTVIASVCDSCAVYGKKVIIVNSDSNPNKETKLVRELLEQRVDGLLVLSGNNYDFYHDIDTNMLPVVLVDRIPPKSELVSVSINHAMATSKVINSIMVKGYKRVVLIMQPHKNPNNTPQIRADAAVSACERWIDSKENVIIHKMSIQEDTISDSIRDLSRFVADCYEQSRDIPTAIFAVEATVMDALVNVYYHLNLKISPNFMMAGYGDWKTKALIPSIPIIEQPLTSMGKIATEKLVSYIDAVEQSKEFDCSPTLLEPKIYFT